MILRTRARWKNRNSNGGQGSIDVLAESVFSSQQLFSIRRTIENLHDHTALALVHSQCAKLLTNDESSDAARMTEVREPPDHSSTPPKHIGGLTHLDTDLHSQFSRPLGWNIAKVICRSRICDRETQVIAERFDAVFDVQVSELQRRSNHKSRNAKFFSTKYSGSVSLFCCTAAVYNVYIDCSFANGNAHYLAAWDHIIISEVLISTSACVTSL